MRLELGLMVVEVVRGLVRVLVRIVLRGRVRVVVCTSSRTCSATCVSSSSVNCGVSISDATGTWSDGSGSCTRYCSGTGSYCSSGRVRVVVVPLLELVQQLVLLVQV